MKVALPVPEASAVKVTFCAVAKLDGVKVSDDPPLTLNPVLPEVRAVLTVTFAEGAVYKSYTKAPVRVFGLSVTDDQQLAGAIMKVGGSVFLWTIIVVLFFSRFAKNWEADNSYRRRIPDAEVVGNDEVTLTYDEVTRAFDNVPAPSEPK